MGQCSSSQQKPEAVEQVQQQPAASVDSKKRGSTSKLAGRSSNERQRQQHMNQPYHASSHDELVLMVSLDSLTKIMLPMVMTAMVNATCLLFFRRSEKDYYIC